MLETSLYYCQSRYYDSELGRFINGDAFASTGQGLLGNNMFAYCLNNPVIHRDDQGYHAEMTNTDENQRNDLWPDPTGGYQGTAQTGTTGNGFSTFKALKSFLGSAGPGKHWHHIVEQSQVAKSGFSAEQINNTSNVVAVDQQTHAKISGYYSSKTDFSGKLTVRDWLAGKSFDYQYQFGMDKLNEFSLGVS